MRLLTLSLTLACPLLLAACGGGGDPPPAAPPATVQLGGTLAGLGAGRSVVIADASGPSASLNANGSYSLAVAQGTAYDLRIAAQPPGQTCAIANGSGTAAADVTNIAVTCKDDIVPPEARLVTGTLSGLGAGKSTVLQLQAESGLQETSVNADGSFSFPQPVAGSYTVTVRTAPAGQSCTVASGSAITVTCAATATSYKLGGTMSGNAGVVILRNDSSGELLTVGANGAFSFVQPLLPGGRYAVAVLDHGGSQVCSVAGGSGTADADVTALRVHCAAVVADPAPPPPVVAPSVPAGLTLTYGVKAFHLAWSAVAAPAGGGAVSYRLFEDPDGAGPTASTQIGGALGGTTYTHVVTSPLHTRLNAQYALQACNSAGCGSPTASVTPDVNRAIAYLKASNAQLGDQFGTVVAISADGNTLAVGAPFEDGGVAGVDGNQADNSVANAGAVYVFTRSGAVWSHQAYLKASNPGGTDTFALSLALSGDGNTLAVGAPLEDSNATGVNGDGSNNLAVDAGAVYVFGRSGGAWSQQAYLKGAATGAGDQFGHAVGLSADGNTMVVGVPLEDGSTDGVNGDQTLRFTTNAGAAYVFTRTGATWSQQAYLKAGNVQMQDRFGQSVAVSGDGATVAVGAHFEDGNGTGLAGDPFSNGMPNSGAAYVFTASGGVWSQQAYVKASNTGNGDQFGFAVALSGNGDTLAVAANTEAGNGTGVNGGAQADNSALQAGAVYVFSRSAGTWAQQAYVKASNTRALATFGNALALASDGNTLAVGSRFEFSNATGIGGNQADTSAFSAGAVYLFTRAASVWTQAAYLKAPNAQANDQFGVSVSLTGDGGTLAVGASREAGALGAGQADNSADSAGAVYLY